MFTLGEVPDVTGWEDITAKIKALREESKRRTNK